MKRMRLAVGALLAGIALVRPTIVQAGDNTRANDPQVERNMREASEALQRQQQERSRQEALREHPDPHAGRVSVGSGTSVGGSVGRAGGEVNVRTNLP